MDGCGCQISHRVTMALMRVSLAGHVAGAIVSGFGSTSQCRPFPLSPPHLAGALQQHSRIVAQVAGELRVCVLRVLDGRVMLALQLRRADAVRILQGLHIAWHAPMIACPGLSSFVLLPHVIMCAARRQFACVKGGRHARMLIAVYMHGGGGGTDTQTLSPPLSLTWKPRTKYAVSLRLRKCVTTSRYRSRLDCSCWAARPAGLCMHVCSSLR